MARTQTGEIWARRPSDGGPGNRDIEKPNNVGLPMYDHPR